MTPDFDRLGVRAVRVCLRIVCVKALALLSFFVPRERELIVFSMSRGRYCDNSRALFEHMAENWSVRKKVLWLADPRLSIRDVPEKYRDLVVRRHSLRGWYLCSRAQLIVLSHGFGDFGFLEGVARRKKCILLWHAITIKNVGVLDEGLDKKGKKRYLDKEAKYYDALIASSAVDAYYSASYTGIEIASVYATGLPRNDRIANHILDREEKGLFTILYAPTFRDFKVEKESVFFPFDPPLEDLLAWCKRNSIRFLLRPHPNDLDSIRHVRNLQAANPNVFVDSGFDQEPDVVDLILRCDAIVTDYSSIYVDALLIDCPVVFVDYDRDQYLRERGIAYDYDMVTPGPKVKDWRDFSKACEDMVHGAKSWSEHREFVRRLFFKYQDGKSCARVAEVVRKVLDS